MYRYLNRYLHRHVTGALCIAALAVPAAHAAEPTATPPAADANARVPETQYNSAFTGYQPFREQKLAPWRELNDDAHKAGGHIGIFGGNSGAAAGTRAAPPAHLPEHKK